MRPSLLWIFVDKFPYYLLICNNIFLSVNLRMMTHFSQRFTNRTRNAPTVIVLSLVLQGQKIYPTILTLFRFCCLKWWRMLLFFVSLNLSFSADFNRSDVVATPTFVRFYQYFQIIHFALFDLEVPTLNKTIIISWEKWRNVNNL